MNIEPYYAQHAYIVFCNFIEPVMFIHCAMMSMTTVGTPQDQKGNVGSFDSVVIAFKLVQLKNYNHYFRLRGYDSLEFNWLYALQSP